MTSSASSTVTAALASRAAATHGLGLLILFGSRARGDAQTGSDWDFGYLAAPEFDASSFLAAVVETIGSDRVDLVDLGRAGGLLRYRAARDGRVVHEAQPRAAEQFFLDAVQFWCDAAPVIERGYGEILADLTR